MNAINTIKKHESRLNKSIRLFVRNDDSSIDFAKAKAVSAANVRRLLQYAAECGYEVDEDGADLVDNKKYTLLVYENEDGSRRITPAIECRRPHCCGTSRSPRL